MFESLQEGLQKAFKTLSGKGKLTEANMRDGLRLVEQSLLEADVSYAVVKDFMADVAQQALGATVMLSLKPGEQLVGIVQKRLVEFLGPTEPKIPLRDKTNVLMLCGLQGSGKTTTCGKLARMLKEDGIKPLLCAADLQRPAAIDQLHVIGDQLGVPVYSEKGASDPVKVCQTAVKKAKEEDAQVVILDTAGRLAIDEELMAELKTIDDFIGPDQVYFVVDGMTGQDAVNSAGAFNEALEIDGVIMTKLDGDARGGALLSVKHVTGVPIKFIGTGEHFDALEPFRPEGMAGRILGQGDILALVEEAEKLVDAKDRAKLERKMAEGDFTLEDLRVQLESFAKPGLLMKLLSLWPQAAELRQLMGSGDGEQGMVRTIGIINSMTAAERRNPKLIDQSRRNRIASGAGVQAHEVNGLVKEFDKLSPVMKTAGQHAGDPIQMMNEMKGALAPGKQGPRSKKSTGKRLSSKEKAKRRKQRDKDRRRKQRERNK